MRILLLLLVLSLSQSSFGCEDWLSSLAPEVREEVLVRSHRIDTYERTVSEEELETGPVTQRVVLISSSDPSAAVEPLAGLKDIPSFFHVDDAGLSTRVLRNLRPRFLSEPNDSAGQAIVIGGLLFTLWGGANYAVFTVMAPDHALRFLRESAPLAILSGALLVAGVAEQTEHDSAFTRRVVQRIIERGNSLSIISVRPPSQNSYVRALYDRSFHKVGEQSGLQPSDPHRPVLRVLKDWYDSL